MSSRRKATSSSTIVTTTATESSHAPILRIAPRPRPLARRATGRPRPRGDGRWRPDRCAAQRDSSRGSARSPAPVPRARRERRRGRSRRRRPPASARPPAGPREAPARSLARARPAAGRRGGRGAGLRPPTPRAPTRLRRTSRRMPTTSLRAPWTTRGRAPPDRPCRSGPGRRRVRGCPAPARFATAARRPAPIVEGLRRSQPGERDQPGELHAARRASRMRIDRPPLTLPGRAWNADEFPAGLLDGTVGTGHHAHPRRNSPSTRPSPRPGLRRSWAQPPTASPPIGCDSPKRQDRYSGRRGVQ